MKPFLITSSASKDFEYKVLEALRSGYAIDNAPFVHGALLCQWVKSLPNFYEWKLVVGVSLGDLQAEVQKSYGEGFDFLYNPLAFAHEDVFVQWVQRWKRVSVDPAIAGFEQKLLDGVASELKMVEGVQPVQLVGRGELFSSWVNPFVVNRGGRDE